MPHRCWPGPTLVTATAVTRPTAPRPWTAAGPPDPPILRRSSRPEQPGCPRQPRRPSECCHPGHVRHVHQPGRPRMRRVARVLRPTRAPGSSPLPGLATHDSHPNLQPLRTSRGLVGPGWDEAGQLNRNSCSRSTIVYRMERHHANAGKASVRWTRTWIRVLERTVRGSEPVDGWIGAMMSLARTNAARPAAIDPAAPAVTGIARPGSRRSSPTEPADSSRQCRRLCCVFQRLYRNTHIWFSYRVTGVSGLPGAKFRISVISGTIHDRRRRDAPHARAEGFVCLMGTLLPTILKFPETLPSY